jgi:xylulokinase
VITSTIAECDEITEELGGLKKAIRLLGNAVLARVHRFQNSMAEETMSPKISNALASVLLPHDYLNFCC